MKFKKQRILLVEDDPLSQKAAKNLLVKNLDCIVDIAETAKEALDIINDAAFEYEEKGYDFVLMDIHLPDSDGHFLTEVLRKTEQAVESTPIIAITGQASKKEMETFLNMGITAVILIPLTIEKLEEVLKQND